MSSSLGAGDETTIKKMEPDDGGTSSPRSGTNDPEIISGASLLTEEFDILDIVRERASGASGAEMTKKELEKQKAKESIRNLSNPMDQDQSGSNKTDELKETKKLNSSTTGEKEEEFNIMDVLLKRATMAREELGTSTAASREDKEEEEEEVSIMDVVAKRATMAREELENSTSASTESGVGVHDVGAALTAAIHALESPESEEQLAGAIPMGDINREHRVATQPGAYSGSLGEGLQRRENIPFWLIGHAANEDQTSLENAAATASDEQQNEGILLNGAGVSDNGQDLSVAFAVDGDDDRPDMEAQPFNLEASKRRSSMENRKNRMRFGLMALLAVAVVATVVGLVLKNSKEDSKMETTSTPAQAPPLSLRNSILALFPGDTQNAIEISGTPHFKAFQWLMDDPFLLDYPNWRLFQRLALAILFYSTDGPNWYNNSNWLDYEVHECGWWSSDFFEEHVVFGAPKEAMSGAIGNFVEVAHQNPCEEDEKSSSHELEERRIKHLYLYNNGLKGSLPTEVFWLTNLRILSVWLNSLTGTIPSSHIGLLTDLEGLALGSNDLTGSIPTEIGLLSGALSFLGLNSNSFTASIPTELGLLTEVRAMSIDSNLLTGTMPSEMGNLSKLTMLYLLHNALSGTIPSSLGLLTNLMDLALFQNQLTGGIPSELGQLEALLGLGLFANQLTGGIPSQLGRLEALILLSLFANQLSGGIPTEMGELANLTVMSLNDNKFTGFLPTELGALSKLYRLSLHDNKFNGTLPTELGRLTAIGKFELWNCSLMGTIPTEMSKLSGVDAHWYIPHRGITLDLHGNYLTGSLPTELGLLAAVELDHLVLYNNQLTGPIPSEFGLLTALSSLRLEQNELSGNLPQEMEWLAPASTGSLTKLNITSNAITGIIPEGICLIEEIVFDCSPDALCGCRCNCS